MLLNTEEVLTLEAIPTIVPKVVLAWQDLNLLTPICSVMFLKMKDILGACPGVMGETLVLTLIIEDIASMVANFGDLLDHRLLSPPLVLPNLLLAA